MQMHHNHSVTLSTLCLSLVVCATNSPTVPVACLLAPGPKPKLDDTVYSQPALYVANLAAVEVARQQHPAAVAGCRAAAGLSLGEYSALVFAGAMSFEDGLKVGMCVLMQCGGRERGGQEDVAVWIVLRRSLLQYQFQHAQMMAKGNLAPLGS
jgi:hypothetical protein